MSKPVLIRQLTTPEVTELLGITKFNRVRPSRCESCGNTRDFERRLFLINGVSKARQNSDEAQNMIRHHLRINHGIIAVVFKSREKKFYADSAACLQCGSTVIEFDVELTDDLLAEMAAFVGMPPEKVKKELEALYEAAKRRSDSV